ncbi:MAG: hypothetical protein RL172_1362 [Bacteroidota bacterium]|jgi:peptide-methionine (R)-S-oxide reductase
MRYITAILLSFFILGTACNPSSNNSKSPVMNTNDKAPTPQSLTDSVVKTDEEWKKTLPEEVYYIARQKGTEAPFTGKYYQHKDTGTYYCAACGNPLFTSNGKFESSCGWPSFFEPINKGSIIYAPDHSHGMNRTEVMCGRCKAHLGHVFEDGPPPTGLRYCINSVILDFKKAQAAAQQFDKDKQ